jgi:hypothetical protein
MSKNPRRVAAGRRNRAQRRPLTTQTLQRLSAAAAAHQPWTRSTGPKTAEGKRKTAQNARKRVAGPPPPEPEPLLDQLRELFSKTELLRKCDYLDTQTIQLKSAAEVADALQATLTAANRQLARQLSAALLGAEAIKHRD